MSYIFFATIKTIIMPIGFFFFTKQAITGLNGMQLGEKKLVVQRASVGAKSNMNNVRIFSVVSSLVLKGS